MSTEFRPGYHLRPIERGEIGEISKISEELEELKEAMEQNARIMALVELADLIGAIKLYLTAKFPGFTLADLEQMADIAARAFRNGRR